MYLLKILLNGKLQNVQDFTVQYRNQIVKFNRNNTTAQSILTHISLQPKR